MAPDTVKEIKVKRWKNFQNVRVNKSRNFVSYDIEFKTWVNHTLNLKDWLHRQNIRFLPFVEPVKIHKVYIKVFSFEVDGITLNSKQFANLTSKIDNNLLILVNFYLNKLSTVGVIKIVSIFEYLTYRVQIFYRCQSMNQSWF